MFQGSNKTYVGAVGRRATIVCLSHFVKIILVQLSDETGHIAVLEVLGKDGTSKFFVLGWLAFCRSQRQQFNPYLDNDKGVTIFAPSSDILMRRVLEHS